MKVQADRMHFKKLNSLIRETGDRQVTIDSCTGQRYIGKRACRKGYRYQRNAGKRPGLLLERLYHPCVR